MVSRYSGCSSYSVALSRYTATLSNPGLEVSISLEIFTPNLDNSPQAGALQIINLRLVAWHFQSRRAVLSYFQGCVFFAYSWGLFTYGSPFFTYGGGTVSKKYQIQFPAGGRNRKLKRPSRFSTVSKKDQTEFQPSIEETQPNYRKQRRPTVSKKDLAASKQDLPYFQSLGLPGSWTPLQISCWMSGGCLRGESSERSAERSCPRKCFVSIGKSEPPKHVPKINC